MSEDPALQAGPTGERPIKKETSRRRFLRYLMAGLAVAIPSSKVLWDTEPAKADPPHNHCGFCYTYLRYTGHSCQHGRMIGYYDVYCSVCGYYCRTFTVDEGPC
ncbi:hypothetical protein GCM10009687_63420 [Asanoa iriomotensis]|uniref:Twin-arginine translocation signal domain-containing protein n=1 Tax=Asanoa iriomotensis TaxID=234613 RepID=A0ABQ4C4B7_9ACTN|nr:hypothetical protein Air01nite_37120 [Asanoa iriomotensis]